MPFVTITEEAEDRARQHAAWHVERATRNDWNKVGYEYPGRAADTFGGYCGEAAFATFIGVVFDPDPDGFSKPDVGGWAVRYATKRSYGLVLHDRDHAFPYVLVVPGRRPLEYEIAGWLEFDEAWALRARGVGRPLPGSTHPWVIPRCELRPWGQP